MKNVWIAYKSRAGLKLTGSRRYTKPQWNLDSTRDNNSRAGLKLKTERKMAVHQAAMKIGFHKEYQFTGRRGSTGDPTCKEYNQTAMKCSLQEKQVTSWRMSAMEHETIKKEYNQTAMKCCQREQQVTSWRVNDLDENTRKLRHNM